VDVTPSDIARLRIPPKPGHRSGPRRPVFRSMPGRCEAVTTLSLL